MKGTKTMFEWCFAIGQRVIAIDVDGLNIDDICIIINRTLDEDDNEQYFDLKRESDGEIWEDVAPAWIEEFKEG